MAAVKISLYPPSPRNVPEDLAKSSPMYRRQVVAVLCSLFVFLALYAAVLVFTFWLMMKAYRIFPLFAIPVLLVLLFFVKGLFKWHRLDEAKMIEVTPEDQPVLFEFIHKVCDELGAPDPDNVYLVEDVNACVTCKCSLINLLARPKRTLLIGLGLVNVMTLDEFKGVLAHEFGHLAQGAMRLGVYVGLANKIIYEIVFGKDFWDRWLDRLRNSPNGFAVLFGNCLYWPTWLLGKLMAGIFILMNGVACAMSRQQEFNADLAAVRLVGSDSAVHGLLRAGFGGEAFNQAVIDLRAAAQHHHYSWDFYHHHLAAMDHLRRIRRKPKEGIPPPLPADPAKTTTVFNQEDYKEEDSDTFFASHPPDYQRERNAKRLYVRSVIDERSPWLLFQNVEELRTKITKRINKEFLDYKKKFPLVEPVIVQEFIDAEHAETTYDPKYHGMYDDRYVDPGRIGELVQEALAASPAPKDVYASLLAVYPATLVKKMDKYFRHREEMATLIGYRNGTLRLKGRKFKFRKKTYHVSEIPKLIKKVDKDQDADHDFLKTIDRDVFLVHYRMAKQQGETRVQQFLDRYRFHLATQEIIRSWNKQQNLMDELLGFLADKEQLHPDQFEEAADILRDASDAIRDGLRKAAELQLPALSNMEEGTRLDLFIVEGKLVKHFDKGNRGDYIRFKWIADFLRQLHTFLERIKRVHFKSLGVILTLQEQIAREWCATHNLALPQAQDKKPEEEHMQVLEVVEVLGPVVAPVKPAAPPRPAAAAPPRPMVAAAPPPVKKAEPPMEVLEVVEVIEPVKPAAPKLVPAAPPKPAAVAPAKPVAAAPPKPVAMPVKQVKPTEAPLEVLEVVEVREPVAKAVTAPKLVAAVPAKPAVVAQPKPAPVAPTKPAAVAPPKPAVAPPKPVKQPVAVEEDDEEVVDLSAAPVPAKPSSPAQG